MNGLDVGSSLLGGSTCFPSKSLVSKEERTKVYTKKNFQGCTIWLTGLSSSGKSSLAFALEKYFIDHEIPCYVLDGDNLRSGLNSNLGFTSADRDENVRRVAHVSKLFADVGFISIVAIISPFSKGREAARLLHKQDNVPFFEVFLNTPLETCKQRDYKGLYEKACKGEILEFTGISSPYEEPSNPDLRLDASVFSVEDCTKSVLHLLCERGVYSEMDKTTTNGLDCHDRLLCNNEKDGEHLPVLNLTEIDLQWLQVLSEGWAAPLKGFMRETEYVQCLHFRSFKSDGVHYSQSVPIIISCSDEFKLKNSSASCISLNYKGREIGFLENPEFYKFGKEEHCAKVFGTTVCGHPSIDRVFDAGNWLIGGDVKVFNKITWSDGLDEYRLTPAELKEKFMQMKADCVFAFQLRNPIHNGHALLIKETRNNLIARGFKKPILLLHPLGGWTKDDDVPLNVRIRQHLALMDELGGFESTVLAIFPSPMLYAGPVEVQWHAKARMVAGVNFYIVGRDPAGLPHPLTKTDLYDPTHGSMVLSNTPYLEKLEILPYNVVAFNKKNRKMEFVNKDNLDDYEFISGTKMRQLAKNGMAPPEGFMNVAAWKVLADYYQCSTAKQC